MIDSNGVIVINFLVKIFPCIQMLFSLFIREFIAKEIVEYLMNRPAPYVENFQFELPIREQWDKDETIVRDKGA